MDALDVARICLRRWYVSIPVVLLAVLAGYQISGNRAASYAGSGSFALIYRQELPTRPNQMDPRIRNPFAQNGMSLLQDTLMSRLSAPAMQRKLAAKDLTAQSQATDGGATLITGSSYAVTLPDNSQSMIVSAAGPDPTAVRDTVDRVLKESAAVAAEIQAEVGAPANAQYTTFVTAAPQVTEVPPPSRVKLLVAFTGVGGLTGAALSLLVERLAVRRRLSRQDPTRGRRSLRRRRQSIEDEFAASPEAERASVG